MFIDRIVAGLCERLFAHMVRSCTHDDDHHTDILNLKQANHNKSACVQRGCMSPRRALALGSQSRTGPTSRCLIKQCSSRLTCIKDHLLCADGNHYFRGVGCCCWGYWGYLLLVTSTGSWAALAIRNGTLAVLALTRAFLVVTLDMLFVKDHWLTLHGLLLHRYRTLLQCAAGYWLVLEECCVLMFHCIVCI